MPTSITRIWTKFWLGEGIEEAKELIRTLEDLNSDT